MLVIAVIQSQSHKFEIRKFPNDAERTIEKCNIKNTFSFQPEAVFGDDISAAYQFYIFTQTLFGAFFSRPFLFLLNSIFQLFSFYSTYILDSRKESYQNCISKMRASTNARTHMSVSVWLLKNMWKSKNWVNDNASLQNMSIEIIEVINVYAMYWGMKHDLYIHILHYKHDRLTSSNCNPIRIPDSDSI